MIKISMNGGVSKAQNPYVPITVEEYAAEIGQFLQLGIKHFHIHFRDAGGKESLEQEVVLSQFLALKKRFPNCQIGIGSPLQNGMTAAKRQKAIAAWTWRPDYISVNVCEEGSCALSKTLQQLQVPIEYGIFTLADAEEFVARQYSQSAFRVLIEVSGEATDEATVEKAAAILTFLQKRYPDLEYLLHGEDIHTWAVIQYARQKGYAWRIGFEDIDCFANGEKAHSNIELYKHCISEA